MPIAGNSFGFMHIFCKKQDSVHQHWRRPFAKRMKNIINHERLVLFQQQASLIIWS